MSESYRQSVEKERKVIARYREAVKNGETINWSALCKGIAYRAFFAQTVRRWQEAGEPDTWPLPLDAAPVRTVPTVSESATVEPSPLRDAVSTAIRQQAASVKELAFQLQAKPSEVMAALETMPGAREAEDGRWWIEAAEAKPLPYAIQTDRTKIRLEGQVKDLDEKYREALRQIEETETRFEKLLAIKEPIQAIKIEADESNTRGEAVAIVQASDWHVEESVEPATVNGLNTYNLEIARRRAENYFRNTLKLIRKERQDVEIKTLIFHLGGDTISNYLHPELEESNNLSPVEAIRFAKELFVGGLRLWRDDGEFDRIQVVTSYGNHGRLTHKPRFSTGHKNNLEWMAYHDLATIFADDSIISFQIADSYFNYLEAYGRVLRFHHGDAVKYGGGIGGLSIPLTKFIHRANQHQKADADFIGHFHQLMPYSRASRFIVNGSLIGFNAYALRIGASPEEPLQSFHLLDAKRGFTISAPVIVESEIGNLVKAASVGWGQAK